MEYREVVICPKRPVSGESHWLHGRKASKLTRYRQSIAKLGKLHPKYKGFYIVNGRKYYSSFAAGKAIGVSNRTIIRRCRNPKFIDYSFVLDPNKEF